ncbi:MAG: hypothetical protein VX294_03345 [Candidatus Latescibacterota bacterium]|nr:hypothetical protein [Candidatus Latescibacterota bacterium]
MKKIYKHVIFCLFSSIVIGSIAVWSQLVMRTGKMRVESNVENLRREPNGPKIGTMIEGGEVELIAQEGNWVRVRVEGWMWGPSLEGFVEEVTEIKLDKKIAAPVDPLIEALPRVRRLVNEDLGKFYGLNIDSDLRLLRIRFRVGNIGLDRLVARQCKLAYAVWDWVGDNIDVDAVRVESNLPDGNGTVGRIIAEIPVENLNQVADGSVEEWINFSRFSSDEGKNWSKQLSLNE